jgi:hypothetical protein
MVAIGTDAILPSARQQPKNVFFERLLSREANAVAGSVEASDVLHGDHSI